MRASCGNGHGAVTAAASLDVVAVHAWCSAVVVNAHVALLLSVVVDVFEVEGVDVTREDAGICQYFKSRVRTARGRVTHPSKHKQMLIKRSAPHPAIMKTPTGGKRTVIIIRRICEIMLRVGKADCLVRRGDEEILDVFSVVLVEVERP
jgi:hypothetical protein